MFMDVFFQLKRLGFDAIHAPVLLVDDSLQQLSPTITSSISGVHLYHLYNNNRSTRIWTEPRMFRQFLAKLSENRGENEKNVKIGPTHQRIMQTGISIVSNTCRNVCLMCTFCF